MPSPHPTNPPQGDQPTAKQLRALRGLAHAAGETFTYPATKADASREIQRISGALIADPGPRFIPWQDDVQHARDLGVEDAVQIREDEITGYGADAHWTRNQGREDWS